MGLRKVDIMRSTTGARREHGGCWEPILTTAILTTASAALGWWIARPPVEVDQHGRGGLAVAWPSHYALMRQVEAGRPRASTADSLLQVIAMER